MKFPAGNGGQDSYSVQPRRKVKVQIARSEQSLPGFFDAASSFDKLAENAFEGSTKMWKPRIADPERRHRSLIETTHSSPASLASEHASIMSGARRRSVAVSIAQVGNVS